jgi:hypothetical protein
MRQRCITRRFRKALGWHAACKVFMHESRLRQKADETMTTNDIVTTDLGGATFAYTLQSLPKYEARIGAWDPKNPEKSKYCITLNADGAFLTRYAGKEYSRKTAERFAKEWLVECAAKRAA